MTNKKAPGSGNGPDDQSRAALQERLHRVARLYLHGKTQQEIAEEVGVHRRTIIRDMKRIRKIWQRSAAKSYQSHVDHQLARLDEIERNAWLGWERSLGDAFEWLDEETTSAEGGGTRSQKKRKQMLGNASFLKIAADAVQQRSQLLGLMDEDARNAAIDEVSRNAEVVSIVIEDREEADQWNELSLQQFRQGLATVSAGTDEPPEAEASDGG